MRTYVAFVLCALSSFATAGDIQAYFELNYGANIEQVENVRLADTTSHLFFVHRDGPLADAKLSCTSATGAPHSTAAICGGDQHIEDMKAEVGTGGTHDAYFCGWTEAPAGGSYFMVGKGNESGKVWLVDIASADPKDRAYALTLRGDYVYICGYKTNDATGTDLTLVVLEKSDGDFVYGGTFTGAGKTKEEPTGIAVDADGNAYVSGHTTKDDGAGDFLAVKFDPTGVTKWTPTFGTAGVADAGQCVAVGSNGVYFGGYLSDASGPGDQKGVVYKLDPVTGSTTWTAIVNDANLDVKVHGVGQATDGTVFFGAVRNSEAGAASPQGALMSGALTSAGSSLGTGFANGVVAEFAGFQFDPDRKIVFTGGTVKATGASGTPDFAVSRVRFDGGVSGEPVLFTNPSLTDHMEDIALDSNENITMCGTREGVGLLKKSIKGVVSVSVAPSPVVGGNPITMTPVMSERARASGFHVLLGSSNNAVQSGVPMDIPEGAFTGNKNMDTYGVNVPTTVNVFAQLGTSTRTTNVTVTPARIASVTVNPASVFGGSTTTGTVNLNGSSYFGGYSVNLSDDSAILSTPASLNVNGKSGNFTITTSNVASSATRRVFASKDGVSKLAFVTVNPGIKQLSIAPSEIFGQGQSTGTVTLWGPAVAGTDVTLTDDSTAITVPATVNVPTGQVDVSFVVVAGNVNATVTRHVFAKLGTVTKSNSLTIKPNIRLIDLQFDQSFIVAGETITGTVTISHGAPDENAVVTLVDNTSVIDTPASVTILFEKTTGTFTAPTHLYDQPIRRTITATYNGISITRQIQIEPSIILRTFTISPTSVKGGNDVTGQVFLAAPAPAGGKEITLTDNTSVITPPPTVTVPFDAYATSFTIATSPVSSSATRQVYASADGITKTANLTLTP